MRAAILLFAAAAWAQTDRPQLVSSSPAQGQSGVLPSAPIVLVFSKPMDATSLSTTGAFKLTDFTTGYTTNPVYLSLSADGKTATLNFSYLNLRPGEAYRLDIDATSLRDRTGAALLPVAPILFDTMNNPDRSGPKVIGVVPADGETGVAINSGIYVVFDRPISNLPYDSGIQVNGPAGPLKFTATLDSDRILQIKTSQLLPLSQRISVTAGGMIDRNGVPLAQPAAFSFQTGILPDTRQQATVLTPPFGTLARLPVRIGFAKPIDAPLFEASTFKLQPYTGSYAPYGTDILASARLMESGRAVVVDAPQVPPGTYQVVLSIPFDRTTGKLSSFYVPVALGAAEDRPAPRLLAAMPPDGATGVPQTALLRLAFSAAIDFTGASFTVATGDQPVAGDFTVDTTGRLASFKPRGPLQASAAYSVSATGLKEYAGNALPDYAASFTTGSSGYTDAFRLVSSEPAGNATGVDPLAPIVLTFNHPVDPTCFYGVNPVVNDSSGKLAGEFTVRDAVVTFRPSAPIVHNAYVSVTQIVDFAGASATGSLSYYVAAADGDTRRPTIVSATPGDGGIVHYAAAHVELTFSKPINSYTAGAVILGSFQTPMYFAAYRDNLTPVPLKATVLSNTRVALEFTAPPDTTVTLLAMSGIVDLYGNNLVPFRTTVRTSSGPAAESAHLIRSFPSSGSFSAPNDATFTALWSAPLDRASVEQNWLAYTVDGRVSGRFVWTEDSKAFTFAPSATFRDGAQVYFAIYAPAHDAAGQPITMEANFNIAYHNPPTGPLPLGLAGSNFVRNIPSNFVIEILFNQDLTDAQLSTVKGTLGRSLQQMAEIPFVRVRPRLLRFKPPVPFLPQTVYYFNLEAGTLKWPAMFTTGTAAASASPTVLAVAPAGTDAPVNAQISMMFSEPVGQFLLPDSVKVTANGVEVPMQPYWTSDQGLLLSPPTLLAPDTTYTVTLSGIDNAAGVTLPTRTWTFRTGNRVDTAGPKLLRAGPNGSNAGPDAVVTFTFDEAIAPDGVAAGDRRLSYARPDGLGTLPQAATLGFSDDLRTLYLRPSAPLAAGAKVTGMIQGIADLSGNSMTDRSASATFDVGYSRPEAPAVSGVSPRPETTGAPLNTRIQARFTANVTGIDTLTATISENGASVPATVRVEADGLTITILPERPLAMGSRIDVAISGFGNAPYGFGFQTGSEPDLIPPSGRSFPNFNDGDIPTGVVVRIRFNEPINPLSAAPDKVTLRAPNGAFVDAAISIDDTSRLITVVPSRPLTEGSQYTLTSSATDLAGNATTTEGRFSVGLTGAAPTALLGIDPADGTAEVNVRPTITAIFSRPVEPTLGDDSIRLSQDGVPVAGQVTFESAKWMFAPKRDLIRGAQYRAEVRGAADGSGNLLPDASSTFTVMPADGTPTPLRLLSSSPAQGAAAVAADAPIRLTFNRPVTLGSALSLFVTTSSSYAPTRTRVEGNDLVIEPLPGFPAGGMGVRGTIWDNSGYTAQVNLFFTVAPSADTTPPTLEWIFPAPGSTIPVSGGNIALRFSEPVIVGSNGIRIIGGTQSSIGNTTYASDGRTVTLSPYLPPDADITLTIGAGVTDLAGNAFAPAAYTFHTLSTDESDRPKVKSITPSTGALNVPVDTAIEFQFTHAMDPVAVGLALHVTADGVAATGSVSGSDGGRKVRFTPDLPFAKGALVMIALGPISDAAGQLTESYTSWFTAIKDAAADPSVVAISASADLVDLRFDGPLGNWRLAPTIREGQRPVAAHWEVNGDHVRIVPEEPLVPGRRYVVSAEPRAEFPVTVAARGADIAVESVEYEDSAVRIGFSGPIDAVSVGPATVRVQTADGIPVAAYADIAADGREMVLRVAGSPSDLVLVVDGLRAAGGSAVQRVSRRVSRR